MNQKVICFGELLMRLNGPGHLRFSQTDSFEVFYTGSEANVAVLLARLGTEASFVSRLPDNDLGDAALNNLKRHGVDTRHILRGKERLGIFFTESGASLRPTNIIYDRGHSGFSTLAPGMIDWSTILKGASWFHWSGISAAVSESAAQVCLEALKAARQAGVRISADFNYRSKLWNYGKHPSQVMPELLSYCNVVNGDLDTASLYFDIKLSKTGSREEVLQEGGNQIKKKLPAMEVLAMTFREQSNNSNQKYSGVLISDQMYQSATYELGNVVERIGTGDAFMGGLIHALGNKASYQKSIDFATAAGALKHSITGDFAMLTSEEINRLLADGNPSGKVLR